MQSDFAFDVGERVKYILDPPIGAFVYAVVTDRGYRRNNGNVYYIIRVGEDPRKRVVCTRSLQSI